MYKLIIPILTIISLSACAPKQNNKYEPKPTQAQIKHVELSGKFQNAIDYNRSCTDEIKNTEEYVRLNDKFVFDINDERRFEKIINNDNISELNKEDFMVFMKNINGCRNEFVKNMKNVDNRFYILINNSFIEQDANLSDLIRGKISVGEYNKNKIRNLNVLYEGMSNIDSEISMEIQRSHEEELKQREEIASEILNLYLQRRALKQ